MQLSVARGTRDILPQEIKYWQHIEQVSKKVFDLFGVEEIRTPIFESTELFTHSIGADTDIVSKEMYTFMDRKNRSLTLRPEGTASIVRAYLNNIQASNRPLEDIFKVWYSGPMFRYERPQAGRYRQFHQVGVEMIGAGTPMADAEMISLAMILFEKIGISDLTIKINSVGCEVCRPVIRERIKSFLGESLSHLCEDCRSRFERNPLRILDCKKPQCQNYFSGMPDLRSCLCQVCQDHHHSLLEYLGDLKINYKQDSRLVRGLDYYNRTVFELVSDKLGAQDAVLGGGRYDKLVEVFGGKPMPAVGFAFGVERAVTLLQESHKYLLQNAATKKLQVIALGAQARLKALSLTQELRKLGHAVEVNLNSENMKALFKKANRDAVDFVLVIGDDELEKKSAQLKDMKTGKQTELKFDKIIERLDKTLK